MPLYPATVIEHVPGSLGRRTVLLEPGVVEFVSGKLHRVKEIRWARADLPVPNR